MHVKSFFITIWRQILLGSRIFLDCATSLLFGIIYCRETRKIECAKNPILLESATSLAEKIRKKQLKSVEVIAAYISRIKEIQPILNVVVENRFEQALEEGRNVDELIASQIYTEEALEQRFPLLGVPFSSKEALAVKGMRVTCGLVWKSDNLASEDCDAVKLLRKAGAIPLVTTNVPEMCSSWESYNKVYGRSKNPYNIKRTVGGSSGGEGGLLGAGGSVIGIGSDLGGSIRIPALFNGIFAHKPSKRIVSIKGILPRFLHDNEDYCVVGPMTRYSTDLSLMMKVLAGNNASRLKLDEKVDLRKIRIYYMKSDGGKNPLCTPVSEEMKNALHKVLEYFEETFNIEPQEINQIESELSYSFDIWFQMLSLLKPLKLTPELEPNYKKVHELFKWITGRSKHTLTCTLTTFTETNDPPKPKYIQMTNRLKREFENILKNDTIFLYPCHPQTAIFHHESLLKMYNIGYTAIFNVLGFPVTQCPLGLSSKGLPLGIQVVGGLDQDHLTIAVAKQLEKAFGGWRNPNSNQILL